MRYAIITRIISQDLRLYEDGTIGRGNSSPSGQWMITGAVRLNNFGRVVEHFTREDVLYTDIQWRHKNGAQRVHLTDLDHGTHRTWMSPRHSVTRIYNP